MEIHNVNFCFKKEPKQNNTKQNKNKKTKDKQTDKQTKTLL